MGERAERDGAAARARSGSVGRTARAAEDRPDGGGAELEAVGGTGALPGERLEGVCAGDWTGEDLLAATAHQLALCDALECWSSGLLVVAAAAAVMGVEMTKDCKVELACGRG